MKNVIYRISNNVNAEIYIGGATKFNVRCNQHKHHLLKNTHHNKNLQNHVNKYGFESISFDIIESDCVFLIEREQYYVDLLKPTFNIHVTCVSSAKGLKRTPEQIKNMINGRLKKSGYKKGWSHSEESKKLIGLAHKGKKLSKNHIEQIKKRNTGIIRSLEFRKKISIANTGKKIPLVSRKKISKKLIGNKNGIGHKMSDIHKKIISSRQSRAIYQFNLKGEFLNKYKSIKEASGKYNINRGNITLVANGKRKKSGGFIWKYSERGSNSTVDSGVLPQQQSDIR